MSAYVYSLKILRNIWVVSPKNISWHMSNRANNSPASFGFAITFHLPILVIISHRIIKNYLIINLDVLESNESSGPDDRRIWTAGMIQIDAVIAVWVNPYVSAKAHPILVSFRLFRIFYLVFNSWSHKTGNNFLFFYVFCSEYSVSLDIASFYINLLHALCGIVPRGWKKKNGGSACVLLVKYTGFNLTDYLCPPRPNRTSHISGRLCLLIHAR